MSLRAPGPIPNYFMLLKIFVPNQDYEIMNATRSGMSINHAISHLARSLRGKYVGHSLATAIAVPDLESEDNDIPMKVWIMSNAFKTLCFVVARDEIKARVEADRQAKERKSAVNYEDRNLVTCLELDLTKYGCIFM